MVVFPKELDLRSDFIHDNDLFVDGEDRWKYVDDSSLCETLILEIRNRIYKLP